MPEVNQSQPAPVCPRHFVAECRVSVPGKLRKINHIYICVCCSVPIFTSVMGAEQRATSPFQDTVENEANIAPPSSAAWWLLNRVPSPSQHTVEFHERTSVAPPLASAACLLQMVPSTSQDTAELCAAIAPPSTPAWSLPKRVPSPSPDTVASVA